MIITTYPPLPPLFGKTRGLSSLALLTLPSFIYNVKAKGLSPFALHTLSLWEDQKVVTACSPPTLSFFIYNVYKLICLGDLAFIPRINKSELEPQQKPRILAVFMCAFSRKCSLNFQKDAKSSTTLATFETALETDFPGRRFRYFESDRGSEFKVSAKCARTSACTYRHIRRC